MTCTCKKKEGRGLPPFLLLPCSLSGGWGAVGLRRSRGRDGRHRRASRLCRPLLRRRLRRRLRVILGKDGIRILPTKNRELPQLRHRRVLHLERPRADKGGRPPTVRTALTDEAPLLRLALKPFDRRADRA